MHDHREDLIWPGRETILEFPCGVVRLPNGNTLIADAGSETGLGSKLLEVDREGNVTRHWNPGFRFLHGIKVLEDELFLADTTNNRILGMDEEGTIRFTSDAWSGGPGVLSDGSSLCYPNNIHPIRSDCFMVTDRNNDRYVLVDREGQVQAHGAPGLKRPHNCEPLEGGQVIIANSDNNSVDIVDAAGQVVWRYDEGLLWPRDANRLPDGNVLIADSKNSRVIEVTPGKEMVWSFAVDYFANFYEAHRLPNGHTLISDQQRQQVLEVDGDGQVVWRFRNYERSGPLLDRLQNGSFKHTDGDGLPSDWILATRLSEGGGRLIWGEDPRGKRIPGMEYDRPGALYFQQAVRVQPGAYYTLAGRIGTENLDGVACLQVAFIDEYDALLCDASLSPRGEGFSGTTPLTDDMFEMEVPERAVAANVRIFMSGTGKVFFDQIRFFC